MQPPVVSADSIRETIEALNRAENTDNVPAEKSTAISALHSAKWEGWANGHRTATRAQEIAREARLFGIFPDYLRTIELVLVDPPFATILWRITGTAVTNGFELDMTGSSTLEFDQDARILRSWVHTGQAPTPLDLGLDGT